MYDLLRRCVVDDDAEAWGEFCLVFDRAAMGPIYRRLLAAGYSWFDADDVAIQLRVHLLDEDSRRLKSFAGNTAAELKAWLRTVITNFTSKWLRNQVRLEKRIQKALRHAPKPDRSGPTEAQVLAVLNELREAGIASTEDLLKLGILRAGQNRDASSSQRTLQLWVKERIERFREHLT